MNINLCLLDPQRKSSTNAATERNTKQHPWSPTTVFHVSYFSEQMNDYKFCLPCSTQLHHSQLRPADVRRKQYWQCFGARVMESCLGCISMQLQYVCKWITFTFASVANLMLFRCIFMRSLFFALSLLQMDHLFESLNTRLVHNWDIFFFPVGHYYSSRCLLCSFCKGTPAGAACLKTEPCWKKNKKKRWMESDLKKKQNKTAERQRDG